ncbi:uncharacterized protein LOC128890315 isoform X2 [Hylaeus anthracinus]|uniref:uncharacterized protein LOC128890315 isoform X2 n=1 Tax=Hylaeus anthracinus TaxID=313031 RepID=UPI0023B89CD4|nr:uncharacterized protein LOC128890315 isoform X2 [Hylaeus anthracinus]
MPKDLAGLKKEEKCPDLIERMSRIETVKEDARKLKTTTLTRMGKMFKQRSQTPVGEKSSLNVDGGTSVRKSMKNYDDESMKKDREKSNSLGRMLKLVDKDGSPKKLFHSRAGSLSHILRRQPSNENNVEKKLAEDNTPGIFSRMLNQLRGK